MDKKKHLDVLYPQNGENVTGEYDEETDNDITDMLKKAKNKPLRKKAVRI